MCSRRKIGLRFAIATLLALAPAAADAQGWIEPPPDRSGRWGVERTRTEVRVEVDGRTARVVVSEWFRNSGGRVAEGDYYYPLPGDAAFGSFSLFQGETELRGEIMDAERARAIYEEIVRRRKDPALIELAGHGLLRARVFPIEPGDTRKVTLRYSQLLERAGDALHFRYAAPRVGEGTAAPRPPRAEPSRGAPTPQEPGRPVERAPLDLELAVEDGDRFLDPFSPTHTLETRRTDGRLRVRAGGELDGRLSVFLPLAGEGIGLTLATHAIPGDDGYFMLTLSPGRAEPAAQPRDLTVVLDVSGSMSGEKIEQARAALVDLLNTLEPRDRFRMVAFSSSVRPYALEWRSASDVERERARGWVESLHADGGTNIGAALDEAFRLQSPRERLPVVVFLTDGIPSVGEQSVERIAARAESRRGRTRVFAYGVGHDVNTELLDRLTEAARGTTSYVEPGESVERSLSLLARKIRHPVLTDLALAGAPVRLREVYPVEIPDVFAGEELVLFGRYERPASDQRGELAIRGRRAGRTETFEVEASFPSTRDGDAFLPRLWASRKLGFLTRRTWTEGQSPELVEEIRRVALRYGLPSPYTSYLVTEPRVADGRVLPAETAAGTGAQAPSQGAVAVRRAEEARRMRDVASRAQLEELEREADAAAAGSSDVRRVAGRLFRLDDGVWMDAAQAEGVRVIALKPYSRAYFDVLRAVPELRPYWSAFERISVAAGDDLAVLLDPKGADRLSEEAIREIARGIREGTERSR